MKEPIDQDAEGKPRPKLSAKERVLATLKWREENKVNDILDTKEEAVLQIFANWPMDVHGSTKEGIPVVSHVFCSVLFKFVFFFFLAGL
jgi:hypothetical protein